MRKILSAAVVILWALPIFAADSPAMAPRPLAMADAVAIALEKNNDLAALREELKGSQTVTELTGTLPNPVLELEGTSGTLTNSPDEKSLGIALSQEIPLMPVGSRRKAVARAEADLLQTQLLDQERQLADQTRRAWLEAVLSAQRLELARSQKTLADELVSVAKTRFQAGDLPEFEVQLAELDHRRSSLRTLEAATGTEAARRKLAQLLGFGADNQLPPLAPVPALPGVIPAEDELMASAFERRPDLAGKQREGEREQASLALAKAEAVPSLTVALSYRNERSNQNAYELSGGVLLPGKERTNDHILGLKLSIPLPLFSRNQAEIARVTARASSVRYRQEAARRAIRLEVRDLLAQYRLATSTLALHHTTLGPIARENLHIQHQAFQLGEIGMQTVLDEKRRLGEQQEAELAALQTAHETYSRLESAVGGSLAMTGDKQ